MAGLDFEAIQSALFTRLKTSLQAAGVLAANAYCSRRDVAFSEVPAANQPAMVVLGTRADADRQPGVPTVWSIEAEVAFLVREPSDKTLTVETVINGILRRVDLALERQPNELGPNDDPGTTLYAELTALGAPPVWRCFRKSHQISHGLAAGQAAVSTVIEIAAPEQL